MEVHLNYHKQLEKFIERGMIVKDREKALRILNHVVIIKSKNFQLFS